MSYATRAEVAEKVGWEGGIIDAVEYGLTVDDMPEGDTELREAWNALLTAWRGLIPLEEAVERLLDAPAGDPQ